jgi:hypothetical protein
MLARKDHTSTTDKANINANAPKERASKKTITVFSALLNIYPPFSPGIPVFMGL